MKIWLVAVVLLLSLVTLSAADEFARSYKLSPIHIDRDEFLNTINEVFAYTQEVNRPNETNGTLELGRKEFKASVSLPISKSDYRKFPNVATEATIIIISDKSLIKTVNLMLQDTSRNVEVRGASQDHVSGVINVVKEKLNAHAAAIGGLKIRLCLGAAFTLAITLLVTLNWLGLSFKNQVVIYVGGIVLMQTILWFPSWETIFPGFLATSQSRSFLEEYSPHFTFLGLVVSMVTPIIGFAVRKFRANN
jgi:hypothetical protein